MAMNNHSNSFWRGLVSILRFLIRLIFVVVLAIGLGVGIYYAFAYALPALQRRYIQPVEENTERLDQLEAQHEQRGKLLGTYQARLADLETQNDSYKATLTMLESWQADNSTALATQTVALATLQPLPDTVLTLDAASAAMQSELEAIAADVKAQAEEIEALSVEDEGRSERIAAIERDLQVLEVMEFLTRARLYLSQGNFEQAEANIEAGVDVLAALDAAQSSEQEGRYAQAITQLEEALDVLPGNPVAATDRVDGAWQILVQATESASTPVSPTETATPKVSATPTQTPSE
jgi:tetratricopeptide (TPR) repeat protein